VHVFDSANHLVRKHEDGLHGEPPGAKVEKILQGRPKEIHHQDVVVALGAIPTNVGNSDTPLKNLVEFGLVEKLRVPGLDGLELDGDFLAVGDVDAEVDVAKTTTTDFANQSVFPSNDEL